MKAVPVLAVIFCWLLTGFFWVMGVAAYHWWGYFLGVLSLLGIIIGSLKALKQIPNRPPTVGLEVVFGKRRPKLLTEGFYLFLKYVYTATLVNIEKKTLEVTLEDIRTQFKSEEDLEIQSKGQSAQEPDQQEPNQEPEENGVDGAVREDREHEEGEAPSRPIKLKAGGEVSMKISATWYPDYKPNLGPIYALAKVPLIKRLPDSVKKDLEGFDIPRAKKALKKLHFLTRRGVNIGNVTSLQLKQVIDLLDEEETVEAVKHHDELERERVGESLIAYINSGSEQGITNILKDVIEEEVRRMGFQYSWEEISASRQEVREAIIERLTGMKLPEEIERIADGLPVMSDLGIKICRLNVGRVKEMGELAKEAERRAVEEQQRVGEEIELTFVEDHIGKLTDLGLDPGEAADTVQVERKKATKEIRTYRGLEKIGEAMGRGLGQFRK